MYDFNLNDLKDVERFTRGKMLLTYISHVLLLVITILASAIISLQYIDGKWQQIVVIVAISIYPSIKIYNSLITKQLELNKIYTYMKNNKKEILEAFNKYKQSMEDDDEQRDD